MSSANVQLPVTDQQCYWDNILVGDQALDHSQNFFAQKHLAHEKLEMELINEQMAGLDDTLKDFGSSPKEDKENEKPAEVVCVKQEFPSPLLAPVLAESVPEQQIEIATDKHLTDVNADVMNATAKPIKKPNNLACQWSTQKHVATKHCTKATGALPKQTVMAPPHAYEFMSVYQQKKKEALLKRLEEERKIREFHSRPAPNFNAHHKQLEKQKLTHAVTVAITPQVLKNSRETEEKRRKKLEEWKRTHPVQKFESRSPNVLKEEPFVPKKVVTKCTSKPFNLHMERRLKERKQYDASVQQAMEQRRKQEEEERRKREEERIKELRKLATFKARPNPFK